jgi:hypothetical protein
MSLNVGCCPVDQRPARSQRAVSLKKAVKGAKNSQVSNQRVQVVGVAFDRIRRKTHLQIRPSAPKKDSKTIPLTIQKAYHTRFISWSPICLLGSHCRAQLVRLEISVQGLPRPRNLPPEQHGEIGSSRIPLDPEVCREGSRAAIQVASVAPTSLQRATVSLWGHPERKVRHGYCAIPAPRDS